MTDRETLMVVYYQAGRTLGVKNRHIAQWLVRRSLRTATCWCRWLGWTCEFGPVPHAMLLPMNSEAIVRTTSDADGHSQN